MLSKNLIRSLQRSTTVNCSPRRHALSFHLFSTAQDTNNKSNDDPMQEIKNKLLKSALEQVPVYGWTNDAIVAAAQEQTPASLSIAGMITPNDLIHYCMNQYNQQLQQELQTQQPVWKEQNTPMVDRIVFGMQRRLEYLDDLIQSQQWHQGMAMGVRPDNALTTRQQLQELIDILVNGVELYDVGHVQRLALGAVYVATELHLLTDTSPNYQDTWDFLQQRVQEWERVFLKNDLSLPNSDTFFVASSVATSLASGALSLIKPNGMNSLATAPEQLWNAFSQMQPPFTTSTSEASSMDGTSPSHYESSSPQRPKETN